MVINLLEIREKYDLKIEGVIHIGAHYAEENTTYDILNIEKRIFFEPTKSNFEILQKNISGKYETYKLALGNENKSIEMFVETENSGFSNSILEPKLHLQQYPHILFNKKEEVEMRRLDDLNLNLVGYNFINIDVQCYELEVFKGCENTLNQIDYIMSEINRDDVYENCSKVEQLIEFLSPYGFELVEQYWSSDVWGDGFFIKKR
jgi:FkbM family methyltransferase